MKNAIKVRHQYLTEREYYKTWTPGMIDAFLFFSDGVCPEALVSDERFIALCRADVKTYHYAAEAGLDELVSAEAVKTGVVNGRTFSSFAAQQASASAINDMVPAGAGWWHSSWFADCEGEVMVELMRRVDRFYPLNENGEERRFIAWFWSVPAKAARRKIHEYLNVYHTGSSGEFKDDLPPKEYIAELDDFGEESEKLNTMDIERAVMQALETIASTAPDKARLLSWRLAGDKAMDIAKKLGVSKATAARMLDKLEQVLADAVRSALPPPLVFNFPKAIN